MLNIFILPEITYAYMTTPLSMITIRELAKNEPVPYDLLVMADPSRELVDKYLPESTCFVALQSHELIGIIVLFPLSSTSAEIKNVAIKPEFQNRGIGSLLIEHAVKTAGEKGYSTICIGTANSSTGQLYLYQKLGFELTEIRYDFFTRNYAEPIFEHGIRAKHMLVLTRKLQYGDRSH